MTHESARSRQDETSLSAEDYVTLYSDEFHELYHIKRLRVAILKRSHQAYSKLDDLHRSFGGIVSGLTTLPSSARLGLLVDTRNVTGRNDDDFERALDTYAKQLRTLFQKTAILVRTQIGRIQVARMSKTSDQNFLPFVDRQEAITWLVSGQALPHRTH